MHVHVHVCLHCQWGVFALSVANTMARLCACVVVVYAVCVCVCVCVCACVCVVVLYSSVCVVRMLTQS